MLKKIMHGLKYSVISLFLFGCSKDLDKMTVQEASLYQPDRYAEDKNSDAYRKPLDVLNFTGIQPGMTVIDLLGGGGYYTELFNYIVGNTGKVYIQNNSLFLRFSEEQLGKRLKEHRLKNVIRLDSEFADLKLPQQVDLIFIGLSYHDLYVPREDPVITADPVQVMRQVYAALKPGGTLVITDHAARAGSGIADTPSLHRIDEEWARKSIESIGFRYVSAIDVLRNPDDDYSQDIWKKKVFHKTDRFVHKYMKPETTDK